MPELWICPAASVEDRRRRRWDGMEVARMARGQVPLLPTNEN